MSNKDEFIQEINKKPNQLGLGIVNSNLIVSDTPQSITSKIVSFIEQTFSENMLDNQSSSSKDNSLQINKINLKNQKNLLSRSFGT